MWEELSGETMTSALFWVCYLAPTAVEENVSVISIVGVGGLGKTTLAKYVFEKVDKHFELTLWVCVSDVFDVKEIIKKILKSTTNSDPGNLEMDQLQRQLREKISGKKYLLVLDDVWNEDRSKWLELRDFLMIGSTGSKILVTTRSMNVAEVMRGEQDNPPYQLQGLSEEHSWSLFAKLAFRPGQQQMNPDLVELGRGIVKKCANVPLAIRTVGTLLYGQHQSKWLSINDTELANVTEGRNNIIDVLKVSYHHLSSQLKHCFAYCALWPKDSVMEKEELVRMWMAQGFLVSSLENRSSEDVGEEYFLCLLNRGFFQDVITDEWGNIISCKMHDLMHDLAQKVARGEIVAVQPDARNLDERIRHLAVVEAPLTLSSGILESLLKLESLRTFLRTDYMEVNMSMCRQLVLSLRCLRVLDLGYISGIELLPGSIGKLIHLRYLDLSWWSIEALPDSVLKLWNLQTLNLSNCGELTRLPEDIKKLINLRHLDLEGCYDLTQLPMGITELKDLRSLNMRRCGSIKHMPSGMGNLTAIQRLDKFIVGTKNGSGLNLRTATARLRDLGSLNNLRGSLAICIKGKLEDPFSDEAKNAKLRSKHRLSELKLEWETEEYDHEAVLEGLQPPPNLKKLEIVSYMGARLLPSWASVDQLTRFLPNLVEIMLRNCKRCQHLPLFGQLPSLKRLDLRGLESVEYMESDMSLSSSASTVLFFPSLEELYLEDMSGLRGWWKEEDIYIHGPDTSTSTSSMDRATTIVAREHHHLPTTLSSSWQPPSFPKLAKLFMDKCPNMTAMPLIPCVEVLKLWYVNGNLMRTAFAFGSGTAPASKLKRLEIDSGEHLISIPRDCLQNLFFLQIGGRKWSRAEVDWSSIGQVFTSGALSSLRELWLAYCNNLQSLGGIGLEHLTGLEDLRVEFCYKLELSNSLSYGNGIMPWKALQSLRELTLQNIPKMRALPDGLQYITTLRFLKIAGCNDLEGLPEWISSLTLLETLYLLSCPGVERLPEGIRSLPNLKDLDIWNCSPILRERCRDPGGEYWPLIRHNPNVVVVG
ncbi:hypothetical protein Ancab_040260 [Ancistrocladus abbreviatus]